MATPIPKLDHYKLETEFGGDCVVHKTYEWEISARRQTGLSTWKRERKIGAGSFGNVWLEKEKERGLLRAVKVLFRDKLPKTGFSQELLALIKLKDNEHLFVKFFGWYENSYDVFFAMEYIEHGDLRKFIEDRDPRTSVLKTKEIIKQILEGLQVLHGKGICHRDIKPHNILIASPDPIWVKIADFGTSKRVKGTTLRTRCGTQGYLAPELQGLLPRELRRDLGEKFTHAVDMWSLGCLVHELLTSRTPFLELIELSESELAELGLSTVEPEIDMDALSKYCKGNTVLPTGVLEDCGVGIEGIAFVKNLLAPNPTDRPTATNALQDPWLKFENHWYETLRSEFLALGISLELENKDKGILTRKAHCENIMRFLPASAEKNFPALLLQAVAKGLNLVTLMLLKSPSSELVDHLTWGRLFLRAAEDRRINLVKSFLANRETRDIDAHIDGQTVLRVAVQRGDMEMAKTLLENGAKPGQMLLQIAIESGKIGMVKLLLENKAGIDAEGKECGRAALQVAVENWNTDLVRILLAHGAKPGRVALQAAVERWDTGIIKMMLESGAEPDHKMLLVVIERQDTTIARAFLGNNNRLGVITLQAAARSGDILSVKFLLNNMNNTNTEAVADPDTTALGTALQVAAAVGHTDIVKLLLGYGVDVNAEGDTPGRTALQVAAENWNTEIIRILLENGAKPNHVVLQVAVKHWNAEIIKVMLKRGAKPVYGTLHGALRRRDSEIVRMVLENDSQLGLMALLVAAVGGQIDTVKFLLDNKVDVNARAATKYGRTALQAAVECGHVDTVKLLIGCGANVSAGGDIPGWTALRTTAGSWNTEIMRILIENGAETDSLMLNEAIRQDDTAIVEMLLKKGAEPDSETSKVALRYWNDSIITMMSDIGAIPDTPTLDEAIKRQDIAVILMLLRKGAEPTSGVVIKYWDARIITMMLGNRAEPDSLMLDEAIRQRDAVVVKMLLRKGAKPGPRTSQVVSRHWNTKVIETMLEMGAILDYWTLDEAIRRQDAVMVKMLLRNGVKPGSSTFEVVPRYWSTKIIEIMLEMGVTLNHLTLDEAIRQRDAVVVQMLFRKGVKPTSAVAIANWNTGIIKMMLEMGVRSGPVTLIEAIRHQDTEIVGILMSKGAKPSLKALRVAAETVAMIEIMKLLREIVVDGKTEITTEHQPALHNRAVLGYYDSQPALEHDSDQAAAEYHSTQPAPECHNSPPTLENDSGRAALEYRRGQPTLEYLRGRAVLGHRRGLAPFRSTSMQRLHQALVETPLLERRGRRGTRLIRNEAEIHDRPKLHIPVGKQIEVAESKLV